MKRKGAFLRAWAAACLLTACMQQEPAGPSADRPDTRDLEDPALLAGASSSTNWPVKQGFDTPITLSGKADSILVLEFFQLDRSFQLQPKAISGSLSLLPATAIPALNPVVPIRWSFPRQSRVQVPLDYLDSLASGDTLRFTLRVEIDTLQCLLVGFEYSKSAGHFTQSPFSASPVTSFQMEKDNFFFQGEIDTSALRLSIPGHENSEMSFYIPGTNLHWKTRLLNPLSIGPLPSGTYPLQLIVVGPGGKGALSSRVEIFEVLLRRETITSPWRFSIGQKLLARDLQGPVSLHSASP